MLSPLSQNGMVLMYKRATKYGDTCVNFDINSSMHDGNTMTESVRSDHTKNIQFRLNVQ